MNPLTQTEKAALEEFFTKKASKIDGWTKKLAKKYGTQADDIKQEFFFGAVQQLRKNGDLKQMKWIYAINRYCDNEVIRQGFRGYIPKGRRVILAPLEDWTETEIPKETNGATDEQRLLLLKSMRKLSYTKRMIVWGIAFGHRDRTQLGKAMGKNKAYVNCAYSEAVRQLREIVKNNGKGRKRYSTSKLVTMDGQTKSVNEWCEELNVGRSTYWMRKQKGWTDEECLRGKPGVSRKRMIPESLTIDGQTKPIKQWLEKYGITRQCYYGRIKRGYSEEAAIKTPLMDSHGRERTASND